MEKQKHRPIALPENHPWLMVKKMVRESLGKLPTSLVLVFVVSLAAAVLASVLLTLAEPAPRAYEYLPLRLQPHSEAAVFSAKRLQGTWTARVEKYSMSLQFEDSMFEWIVEEDNESKLRYFARGNFKLDQGVLVLAQRPDMGKPYNPRDRYIAYLPLSLRNINVYPTLQKEGLSFLIPEEERERLAPQFLRFLPPAAGQPLLWTKQFR